LRIYRQLPETSVWFSIVDGISQKALSCTEYLPNKEYVYEYESEALTGIPAASNHLTGIKVLAKVHLQHKGANKFLAVVSLNDIATMSCFLIGVRSSHAFYSFHIE
jgi:hypothetical protein